MTQWRLCVSHLKKTSGSWADSIRFYCLVDGAVVKNCKVEGRRRDDDVPAVPPQQLARNVELSHPTNKMPSHI